MSLPYFPFYPRDFEADTSHFTLEEDGAYNRLLRICWMTPGCSIPDDDAWIMRRMRVDAETFERVVKVVIDEFFTRKAGRILSPRLAKEWQKTDVAHRKRVAAGSKGGAAKAAKTNKKPSSNAVAKPKQPEPEPEPIDTPTEYPPYAPPKSETATSPPAEAQPPPRAKRATSGGKASGPIPEGWAPSNATALRLKDDLDLTTEELRFCFEQMKDHADAKGRKQKDWNAAYRIWVRKSANDGEIGPGSRRRRAAGARGAGRSAIDDA